MIKLIDTYGYRISDLERILNQNSSWKLITFGSNKYHTNGMGMMVRPMEKYNHFMVVESIGDDVGEFKID